MDEPDFYPETNYRLNVYLKRKNCFANDYTDILHAQDNNTSNYAHAKYSFL